MIGVGIAGAGNFAAMHVRALAALPDFRLVAASAVDPAATTAFTAVHGGRPCRDWRDLLDDPAVDVVLITMPHHLHAEVAIAAAGAGKHALVEKPMAPSLAACRAMAAAAATAGTLLLPGQLMRFVRPCLAARAFLASGALGRPLYGRSAMTKRWMEDFRQPWHLRPENGGGMLMTVGIHALDRLVWLMGQEVAAVAAMSGHLFHDQAVPDTDLLLLRMTNGPLGEVASVGYRDRTMVDETELACEGGRLLLDFHAGVRIVRDGVSETLQGSAEPDWMLRGLEREWRAIAAAVQDGASLPVRPPEAAHLVACVEAAVTAARQQREVAVERWGQSAVPEDGPANRTTA